MYLSVVNLQIRYMKHTLLIVCLVNLLSLFSLSAKEVNYIFRHYQVEHGLSDNMVTSCIPRIKTGLSGLARATA